MPLFVAKELHGPWAVVGDVANLTAGEVRNERKENALKPVRSVIWLV
jgi:hypothetical protein